MEDVNASAVLEEGGTVTYRRRSAVPGIEAMHVSGSAKLWRVFHETYTVASILSSHGDWRYRGRSLRLSAGELSLMQPGEIHTTTRLAGPCDFHVLHIAPSVLVRMSRELGARTTSVHFRVAQVDDPRLFGALVRLHEAIDGPASAMDLESRLLACVRSLIGQCTEAAPATSRLVEPARLRRAEKLLTDRLSENVSLRELAAEIGLTRFETVRLFKRHLGVPPHAFQIQLRLDRARNLLQQNVPPSVVAVAVGFADQSHFSRHFKHAFGVTPAVYRGQR